MIAIPVLILALASGVFLLLQVKHFGFGGLYKALAWLVILLSIACMSFAVARGIMHHRCMSHCIQSAGHCDMKEVQSMSGSCDMHGMDHCKMSNGGGANMPCEANKSACCHKGETAADSTAHK